MNLSCSSRDNRVNARPRGCALRRAESSGCELSRASFNRGGNEAEQSDEKARRRVMRTMRYVNTQPPQDILLHCRNISNGELRTIFTCIIRVCRYKGSRFYDTLGVRSRRSPLRMNAIFQKIPPRSFSFSKFDRNKL